MKTLLIAGILAVSSLGASAQSGNGETWGHDTASSGVAKARSEVVQELRAALANQAIAYGEGPFVNAQAARASSTLTRSQVMAEVQSLRQQGRLQENGEHPSRLL